MFSCSFVSDSLQPLGLLPARDSDCSLWDSLGQNTGVGCHFLLQEIFLTQDFWLLCNTNAHPFPLLLPQEQKEKGVAKYCTCRMQCFSVSPQPPYNINSSAILPYFRVIKPFFNDTNNFSDVMDHLKKLELQRAPDIAVPTATYPSKMFIKCVLETFSKCLKSVGTEPPKVTEDHLVDPVPFEWQECKEP